MRLALALSAVLFSLPAGAAELDESNCVLRVAEALPKTPHLVVTMVGVRETGAGRYMVDIDTRIGNRPILFTYACAVQDGVATAGPVKGSPK